MKESRKAVARRSKSLRSSHSALVVHGEDEVGNPSPINYTIYLSSHNRTSLLTVNSCYKSHKFQDLNDLNAASCGPQRQTSIRIVMEGNLASWKTPQHVAHHGLWVVLLVIRCLLDVSSAVMVLWEQKYAAAITHFAKRQMALFTFIRRYGRPENRGGVLWNGLTAAVSACACTVGDFVRDTNQ